jgi:hypothetical protein
MARRARRREAEVDPVQPFRPAVAGRLAELAPLVLAQLDAATDRMVEVLLRTEPAYRELADTAGDELRAAVRGNVERGMRALIGSAPCDGRGGRAAAREVGRRRAAQGFPLEAVLRAYRLGGQVTWEALLTAARQANGGDDPLLLEVAGSVWRTNDRECAEVAEGYREEQRRLVAADEEARRRALDALLDGRGDAAALRAHAELLGLPIRGRLLVVVAMPAADGVRPLSESPLGVRGVRAVWGARGEAQVAVVSLGFRRLSDVVARLEVLAGGPVGVSGVVEGVADVAEAFRLAKSAVRTLPAGVPRVATIDERLPEALLSNSPEIQSRLIGQSFGGLLDLPDEERDVLLGTLAAFLAADGSPTRAADALYCHRNTVMHRLRRIETVTGRKVTDPRSRLLWQLALLSTGHRAPASRSA